MSATGNSAASTDTNETADAFTTAAPVDGATAAAGSTVADTGGVGLCVGQVVEVCCARVGTGGVGVCLWGPSQLVLLVKGALPGEVLTATITAVKKSE